MCLSPLEIYKCVLPQGLVSVLGQKLGTFFEMLQIHFISASCENMIDGKGMLPGDVLTASNGKTVEVRLVCKAINQKAMC